MCAQRRSPQPTTQRQHPSTDQLPNPVCHQFPHHETIGKSTSLPGVLNPKETPSHHKSAPQTELGTYKKNPHRENQTSKPRTGTQNSSKSCSFPPPNNPLKRKTHKFLTTEALNCSERRTRRRTRGSKFRERAPPCGTAKLVGELGGRQRRT